MKGKLMRISGKNLTFQDVYGRNITLPVEKDHQVLLDAAVENLGKSFEVLTLEGKIVDMKLEATT